MKYRIELAGSAKADLHGQALWLREQVSPAADQWLAGLYKARHSLSRRIPARLGGAGRATMEELIFL